MKQPERQAFLDGYRHGLGDAVRRVQYVHDNLPAKVDADCTEIIEAVLVGLMRGLQIISASVVLADDEAISDG